MLPLDPVAPVVPVGPVVPVDPVAPVGPVGPVGSIGKLFEKVGPIKLGSRAIADINSSKCNGVLFFLFFLDKYLPPIKIFIKASTYK
ncbi:MULTISPECIES: hypothetical protein [Bacillus cereus group]|uniref:hypothetical protein n=1 Tax=Bacillus cereus group TaxID=86661 RepID=UPI0022E3D965|nr:hypothetical protein [Bacillus cereus group sp. TH153LC]